jgi:hypothetical protein
MFCGRGIFLLEGGSIDFSQPQAEKFWVFLFVLFHEGAI